MTGRFIVLEGGEGAGKTTQAARLAARLGAVCTREPGGTPVGQMIRRLLLDPDSGSLDPRAEALLVAADRAQHVAEVIRPALIRGRHVVSDRYVGSSLAYQGHARGLSVEGVAELSTWATGGLQPDLVILLDVPPDVGRSRLTTRPDRMESEGADFHERVRAGYRAIADRDPVWVVVEDQGSPDEVAQTIWAVVSERLDVD